MDRDTLVYSFGLATGAALVAMVAFSPNKAATQIASEIKSSERAIEQSVLQSAECDVFIDCPVKPPAIRHRGLPIGF